MPRGRALLAVAAPAALLALGCGAPDRPPVATSCVAEPSTIVEALERVPETVTLEDGTTISGCLENARTDADLQNVGVALSRAAEDLELEALGGDAAAALRLGYLAGAARKGAATTSGIGEELVRRIERSAAAVQGAGPQVEAAVTRGLEAGTARG